MATVEDKLKEVEEELAKTPRNKGTDAHVGKLKAKIARLKTNLEKTISKKSASLKGVKKSGDATVILVGFPSVGKSTLLNQLTNAESKVADYEFTTLDIIPGMMKYKGVDIQLLDVPGLISKASEGKGRGKGVLSTIRIADLIIIMADVKNLNQVDILKKELYIAGLRLNEDKPDIEIKKKITGGISINKTVKLTRISEETIKIILNEYSVHNADLIIREDISMDRFIDSVSKNRVYVPMFVVINKIDSVDENYLKDLEINEEHIFISALKEKNLDKLREMIYEKLDFIRVYMKQPGKEADMKEPLIVKGNSSVLDVCEKIHKDFVKNFNYARVWGGSAKFDAQKVSLKHVLKDKDVVELNLKK